MQIPAITRAGLAGTSQAITRGLASFDQHAQQVTADSLGLASDQPGADQGLVQDMVGMQADAIANAILFKVYQKQSEQQQSLADLIKPG